MRWGYGPWGAGGDRAGMVDMTMRWREGERRGETYGSVKGQAERRSRLGTLSVIVIISQLEPCTSETLSSSSPPVNKGPLVPRTQFPDKLRIF